MAQVDSSNNDIEALLQDALSDFHDVLHQPAAPASPGQTAATGLQEPSTVSEPAGGDSTAASLRSTSATNVKAASTKPPSGLGGGLGPKLPARAKTQQQSSSAAPTPSASTAREAASTDEGLPAGFQLPPHMQQLADDLMKLVEESGFGADDEATGTGSQPAEDPFKALFEQLNLGDDAQGGLAGLGGLPFGPGGPNPASTSAASSDSPAATGVQSQVLKDLMQRTRQVVDAQPRRAGVKAGKAGSRAAGGQESAAAPPKGMLDGLLGGLAGLTGGAGGAGGNFVVDFIMQHLLSKDVLYTPLKEIRDKYPPWLEANASSLPPEELSRYQLQFASLQAVCTQYETAPDNMPKLLELIQEMQRHGEPPAAIVDDISSSINADMSDASETRSGTSGADPDDPFAGMQLPPDMLKDLPKELQNECVIC